jgi:hypothetical protein
MCLVNWTQVSSVRRAFYEATEIERCESEINF